MITRTISETKVVLLVADIDENGELIAREISLVLEGAYKDNDKIITLLKRNYPNLKNKTLKLNSVIVVSQKYGISKDLFMQYAEPIATDEKELGVEFDEN